MSNEIASATILVLMFSVIIMAQCVAYNDLKESKSEK